MVVDYENREQLEFCLAGIDLVISMFTGNTELLLINAAVEANVRRFVPGDFSGPICHRVDQDPFDYGQRNSLLHLVSTGMKYTIFTCGILYERFLHGGLAFADLGGSLVLNQEADFVMDIRTMRARLPHQANGEPVMLCMTFMRDLARFILAALALPLPLWPTEFFVRGERMSVSKIISIAEEMRGKSRWQLTMQEPLTHSRCQL
jgi:hypothetical protein